MEAKLASMGLKSPASPAMRQFARQSLGATSSSIADAYLSPHSANLQSSLDEISSANSAAALASQRSKLKANARISAPANILLGASGFGASDSMKSPLWNEKERVVERRSVSPSPNRPRSTGSNLEG